MIIKDKDVIASPTKNEAKGEAAEKQMAFYLNRQFGDIQTIPGELFAKFQTSFYSDPIDAVFKAIGIQ